MSETTERFVIKSRAEMVEGEPCADTCRERNLLEDELDDFRRRGGNYTGRGFFMEPADQWAIVDLDDDWHRANVEEIPEDPEKLAILICAIAASTPGHHENYALVCEALGVDPDGEATEIAYAAWDRADDAAHGPLVAGRPDGWWNGEIDAEAEALIRDGWSPEG